MCYAVWYFNLISDSSFILRSPYGDEEGLSLQCQRILGLKSFSRAGMAGRRYYYLCHQDLLLHCLAVLCIH